MYQQLLDSPISGIQRIKRVADNAFIPADPANTDYQKYLEWLAEGNTPLPPDDPTGQTVADPAASNSVTNNG